MSNTDFRKRLLIPILAIAIPVSIALAAMELLLRTIGFKSPVIHTEMFVVDENDPLLPHSLRPSYSGVYGGGTVNVRPDRTRVVPLPLEIEESRFSNEIVILGDSVAFGHGLNDEDTIAASLQKQILESGDFARVVLIAAPGYTSWNEYAALSRYTNLSRVRTVVLIYVNNDITMNNDGFGFREFGAKKFYFMEKDIFRKFLRIMYDHSRLFFLISDSIKKFVYSVQNIFSAQKEKHISKLDTDALSYSMEAISQIKDLCRAQGTNLIVAIFGHSKDPDSIANYEQPVSLSLSTIGVDHFVLRWASERLSERQFSASWNDPHPSARANEIIAEEIAAELSKRGIINAGPRSQGARK